MKRFIITGIICITLITSGCHEELFIKPPQSIDQALALSSDANVKRVLIGAYAEIRSTALYGGRIQLFSEMLGANSEVRWEGTFNQPREMYNKQIFVNNSFVEGTWAAAYRGINVSNNVLSALDVINASDRDRVEGEALFIRGSMLFELVKLYAQPYVSANPSSNLGVPIILTPTREINEDSYVRRNTVQEVYQQIVSDLVRAESLLPLQNGILARNYVAAAQLSRVYLQMERFADARDAANRAIALATSTGKALIPIYMNAFNTEVDSLEDLFTIQVDPQDSANDMFTFYSLPQFGARDGDVSIQPPHILLYESGDQRLNQFFLGAGEQRTAKWRDQFRNVKVFRLAEMYLTRAEANFREGTSVGATPLEDINRIRQRVELPSLTSVTLAQILLERKLELAHEGHAIHDIRRNRGTVVEGNNSYPYNDPRLVFPIPQREIDANSNLEQNAGYSN
ncbi:RagB/SusD family nutrient uptake outer membrane protein [Belliella kenyensis]|uniref:RagB/SusD family nutrient uptake outer membrane protein n=1 Tax=Belliella kenyensis TaxID=1472724 RepID=A0ABV8EKF8_9BACT|nr:RagB/SusD family nutrient uptake outer membrane protein [Belliella kenyensis]MCH7401296.1 RagB/SusD family nutrient uptake outer membrane protein [Belliella kenyensis]MDN3602741.1 RagB/SusD family nutrient uptake outer membrane protein [Belliella kenyensis]